MESFYNDLEPWTPPSNGYPTYDDVMRFYSSRMRHGTPNSASEVKQDLGKFDVLEKGDGCPKTIVNITKQFEK